MAFLHNGETHENVLSYWPTPHGEIFLLLFLVWVLVGSLWFVKWYIQRELD